APSAPEVKAVAVELSALGDTGPLWRDWLADASRRFRVDVTALEEELPNWRPLLERFAEERAPVYLRRDADVTEALRRLHAGGVRIGTTDLGNAIRNAVREWARGDRLVAYDQEQQTGYLRHLVVREGRNTGQALVQLVTGAGEKFDVGGLVDVLRAFPEVRSIHWSVNEGRAEVTNLPTQLLWGEEAIEEELCGLRFRVRPNAFLQTNTAMAERLYGVAREFAALTGGETVYDLYCGIGTIGLVLARDALTVWG